VVCGTELGEYAFAAAGSVVTKNVPAHAFVAGNPAVVKGWVCSCGVRLDDDLACADCGLRFTELPDGAGLRQA
jgi:UDP-2-acetamido-3-amino-2,3-dideoxy-glucuronate N-acetyltransferase